MWFEMVRFAESGFIVFGLLGTVLKPQAVDAVFLGFLQP